MKALILFFLFPVMVQAQNTTLSFLEVIDTETGKRNIVWQDKDLIEAPNWMPDGRFLVNSEGSIYTIDTTQQQKKLINTGFAQRCNNDHGISPNGKWLAISHHDMDARPDTAWLTSKIYILPIEGGKPRLVTEKEPSFWHGWSPDGERLAYTARRNDQWDIYTIDINGGKEQRLTQSPGLDDGPDYGPNGKHIFYNSFQTGSMEIWQMKTDGSKKKMLTDDAHSNWFPHPSPDGQKLVYLCFIEDQQEAHPFGQQVKLRMIDLSTGEISDLTDVFYGGQGTINVNSWSPDGRYLAFMRYAEQSEE